MNNKTPQKIGAIQGLVALSPLIVFLVLYLVTSILVNDFYAMPITVAFMVSAIYSVVITTKVSVEERVKIFTTGSANPNIISMVWIFILAGAFAQIAKDMGAIDATVNLIMSILPNTLLPAGVFVAACLISLSTGTSVGTIVALTPVAVGLADKTGLDVVYIVGIVVGGSFFGDNLSFISDTTIAAAKTQGCEMKDKFKVNSMIVFPAALVVLAIYVVQGLSIESAMNIDGVEWIKVLPYFSIIIAAIAGVNVMVVLCIGIAMSAGIGLMTNSFELLPLAKITSAGIMGMGELIMVTLLAGGMLEIIKYNGGIDYIINGLTKKVKGKRGAEFTVASLVSVANLCTANNTIAIITTAPIAKKISSKYGLDKRKTASILDTFSCLTQGLLPYGAQMLTAAELAKISPISIIPFMYYPLVMGLFAVLAIMFRYPKRYS
ncbi:MAG: Na+/H+ antiporter NhaC family protein [Bacteroides sp.]|nr:Na+/H+ antiporter NhaC family protein [Bacteroides sp.]